MKNPRYHLGPPALDEVTFELGGGPALTRYQNDEIHISPVPASSLDSIRDGSNALSKEYRAVPDMSVFYFTLNTSKPPFDDPKVRQAFAMSIDFEQHQRSPAVRWLSRRRWLPPARDPRLRRISPRPRVRPRGRQAAVVRVEVRRQHAAHRAHLQRLGRHPERPPGRHPGRLAAEPRRRRSSCRRSIARPSCANNAAATSRCSRMAGRPTTRTPRTSSASSSAARARSTSRATRTRGRCPDRPGAHRARTARSGTRSTRKPNS